MRACPRCGYKSAETASTCPRCDQTLLRAPEVSIPLLPTALATASMKALLELRLASMKLLLFLLGVALGLLPTAIFYGGLASTWWVVGCLLFFVFLPLIFYAIVQCLEEDRFQTFAYGLFAAVMVTPIAVVVAIITQPILLHFHFVW